MPVSLGGRAGRGWVGLRLLRQRSVHGEVLHLVAKAAHAKNVHMVDSRGGTVAHTMVHGGRGERGRGETVHAFTTGMVREGPKGTMKGRERKKEWPIWSFRRLCLVKMLASLTHHRWIFTSHSFQLPRGALGRQRQRPPPSTRPQAPIQGLRGHVKSM